MLLVYFAPSCGLEWWQPEHFNGSYATAWDRKSCALQERCRLGQPLGSERSCRKVIVLAAGSSACCCPRSQWNTRDSSQYFLQRPENIPEQSKHIHPNMILLPCYSCVYFCLDFIVNQQCMSLRKAVTSCHLSSWGCGNRTLSSIQKRRSLGEGGRPPT